MNDLVPLGYYMGVMNIILWRWPPLVIGLIAMIVIEWPLLWAWIAIVLLPLCVLGSIHDYQRIRREADDAEGHICK